MRAPRPNVVWGAFALLGIANVGMLVGGALWLTAPPPARVDARQAERAAGDAEKRAAALARGVFAGKSVAAAVAAAKKLDGVGYELVAVRGGQARVVAASDAARVGKPADPALVQAAAGKQPPGEIALPSKGAGTSYTGYYVERVTETVTVPVAPAGGGGGPTAQASSRPLRVVSRTVKKRVELPATDYVVKPGDTLYKISRQRYGDASMFHAIWLANRAKIPNQRDLTTGMTLRLPAGQGQEVEVEERVAVYPSIAPAANAGQSAAAATARPAATAKPTARPTPPPATPTPATPTPAPTATPAAEKTAAPASATPVVVRKSVPVTLALRLTLPVATRPAAVAAPVVQRERALALAGLGALGVVGSWWLAALLLDWRRRRELELQRRDMLGLVAERFRPHPQLFDRNAVRSPWQVEHAAAVWPGDDPGGSFTDFHLFTDTKLGLFIGDATGRNATALIYRGVANLLWRSHLGEALQPGRTLLDVNRHLVDYISQGDHVTAFYAQVDLLSGAVTYAAAAHTGAFVLGRRGALTMLSGRGMPLGVGQELFADRLEQGHVRLNEGESLLLFTDGLLKAENANGEPFGLERLEKCLRERPGCNADEVLATIRLAVEMFTGREVLGDEAAIVCLRLVNPLVLYPKLVAEPIGNTVPVAAPSAESAPVAAENQA